ncbi:MAG: poly-gamma-glutamate synthase PgsB [Candidatus Cloacimonetes bacterium 4572_65]|nr:MAG: poly-gamma-glutamate synthase PgsB [Candidatus Cloacimonetes bacterium 4572_65]
MLFLILATVLLVLYWTIEYVRHLKMVNRIPIRIHVNGTRGKSSVTRLIASGLREGGVRTVAKTTGTLPRIIHPDGKESAIVRLMGANIIEQKYILRNTVSMKPDAIVIECMAVNPIYQWVVERRLVKATIGVLTNARLDHTDLMGETVESVAMSLSNFFPPHKVCYTAENDPKIYGVLKKRADKFKTDLQQILPKNITKEELLGFSYIEHEDNIQLALKVCENVGVSRAVAMRGMQKATPDPGALTQHKVVDGEKTLLFYNVFAANDPASTEFLYHRITDHLTSGTKIILLNSRSDRFYRTEQLLDVCRKLEFDYLFLTGESPSKAFDYAIHIGLDKKKVVKIGEILTREIHEKILDVTKKEAHIIGIGNIAGKVKYGAQIVNHFKHLERKQKKQNK